MIPTFLRLPVTCAALFCIVATQAVAQTGAGIDGKPATPPPAENPGNPPKTGFLGVITSKPPRIMTEQLGLKPDQGMVVIALAPDGPALKAGLAVNDLITAVGDSPVRDSQDLSTAVQSHAPGKVVRLKLIRKGEPAEIDVTLGARPEGTTDAREIDRILRKLIEERVAAGENPKDLEQLAMGLGKQSSKAGDGLEIPPGASIRIVDEHGCVEIKTSGDRRELFVRDKDNNVTWSGPWNNETEKSAAPPDVIRRVGELGIDAVFHSGRIRSHPPGSRSPETPHPSPDR